MTQWTGTINHVRPDKLGKQQPQLSREKRQSYGTVLESREWKEEVNEKDKKKWSTTETEKIQAFQKEMSKWKAKNTSETRKSRFFR